MGELNECLLLPEVKAATVKKPGVNIDENCDDPIFAS